jgi:hypothetical protein
MKERLRLAAGEAEDRRRVIREAAEKVVREEMERLRILAEEAEVARLIEEVCIHTYTHTHIHTYTYTPYLTHTYIYTYTNIYIH